MTKSTRAPGKRTTNSAITRSLILSAIEAGATYAQAARAAGVSGARARQVAKEAGLPPRTPGGLRSEAVTTRTARGAAILARVVDLAAAAGIEPEAWLGDAAWTLAAHARAAAELDHLAAHGSAAERAVAGSVRRLICGAPSNDEVRAAVYATGSMGEPNGGYTGASSTAWPRHADGTPFARLCRAEHRQGFDCELEAGHDGPHRYISGGSSIAWSTKIEEDTP